MGQGGRGHKEHAESLNHETCRTYKSEISRSVVLQNLHGSVFSCEIFPVQGYPAQGSRNIVMNIRNSYKTLEVSHGASIEEVKQGYKDLVRVWHPDRFAQDPRLRKKAEEKLKEINRAYGDLMTSFSHRTRPGPQARLHLDPPRWRRYSRRIGAGAARISRDMYERVCFRLERIELGRVYQALFNSGNSVGSADPEKASVENSSENRGAHMDSTGFQKGMDFSSVFDQVAKERRAESKRVRESPR